MPGTGINDNYTDATTTEQDLLLRAPGTGTYRITLYFPNQRVTGGSPAAQHTAPNNAQEKIKKTRDIPKTSTRHFLKKTTYRCVAFQASLPANLYPVVSWPNFCKLVSGAHGGTLQGPAMPQYPL